jgi:cytoskeleton protein RodZ
MSKVTRLTVDSDKGAERRKGHVKDVSDHSGAPLDSVGADLRAARLRLGEDLSSVSDDLRIRREHLDAIENANYAALPGKTYAIGFIRSYAEYLGLDAEAYVNRYKDEIGAAKPENQDLVFPEATDEAKLSQSSIFVLALLLAAGVYGGFYLSISTDKMTTNGVPAVPDRLATQPQTPPTTPAPVTGTAPIGTAPATGTTPTTDVAPTTATETAPPAEDEAATQGAATTPPAAAGQTEVVAAAPGGGQVYGAQHADSRIAVVAKVDTWLRIEGPTGKAYISRNIKAGDSYKAPNVPGLVLVARDAGSLDLVVDGKSVGAAGPAGTVLTGMPLNPQFLATRNQPGQQ